jgi:hypothetical protein
MYSLIFINFNNIYAGEQIEEKEQQLQQTVSVATGSMTGASSYQF